MDELARRAFIRAETEQVAAFAVPELPLHLITPRCRLWRARERDLVELGLPDPFWGFAWAGGQALARFILDRPPAALSGRRVLDFGAGGAVEGLAAARRGAQVLAADLDEFALSAARLNAEANGLALETTARDLVGEFELRFDLVLVGDVLYGAELAERAVPWLRGLASRGAEVWVGDPGRGHVPPDAEVLATVDVPADIDGDGLDLRPARVFRLCP